MRRLLQGTCEDYTAAYRCSCDPGFGGQNCTIDFDECQSSPCRHGTCIDGTNTYRCQCQTGFTGRDCEVHIDECYSSPCVNGTCISLSNNYSCACTESFTSRNCDVIITNCTIDSCYPNVTCFEKEHAIACGPCPPGLTGDGKNCKGETEAGSEGKRLSSELLIGVSCGSFLFIAFLVISFVIHCKRRRKSNGKFDNCELQLSSLKEENLVWVEEKGLWNQGLDSNIIFKASKRNLKTPYQAPLPGNVNHGVSAYN